MEYLVAILKNHQIKGADGQAEDLVSEHLGRNFARLLLHELQAWLRSPYATLEVWDRHVQYVDNGQAVLTKGAADNLE
jgi:hypothetical protein